MIINHLTENDVEKLLGVLNLTVFEKLSNSIYKVFLPSDKFGNYAFILELENDDKTLSMMYFMDVKYGNFEKINNWNITHKFVKAHIENDMLILQLDLLLQWGATYNFVVNFMMAFSEVWVSEFREYILSN